MKVLPTCLACTVDCKRGSDSRPMEPFTRTAMDTMYFGYCTCHESLVRSIMDTLQEIAFCFNYSAKRFRVLQAELELDEDT